MTQPALQTNIYQQYTSITTFMVTSYSADKLDDLSEDYGASNVVEALEQAKRYNKAHSWYYIEAILRSWKAEGKLFIERTGSDYASWNE